LKLGFRLLLIVGHTLGDFALPLMETQCKRAGTTLEALTPAHAEQILPVVERVLSGFVVRPADLAAIMHDLRVEVGEERFAKMESDGPLLLTATER
jgi:hypothetical protein